MQAEAAVSTGKKPATWKIALNIALFVLLIAAIVWQLDKQKTWYRIQEFDWATLDWAMALAAVVILGVCSLLDIFIWNRTLGWFAEAMPFRAATPVYVWSSLARFVPGKVASLAARVTLSKAVGRPIVPVLAASTVELALRTAAALLFAIFALLAHASSAQSSWGIVTVAVVVPIVLIGAHPRVMLPITNFGLRKLKKPLITKTLRYREVLAVLAALVARWAIFGVAFLLLVAAVLPGEARGEELALIGIGPSSWAFGFLTMLPGGLGTMEVFQFALVTKAFGIFTAVDPKVALTTLDVAHQDPQVAELIGRVTIAIILFRLAAIIAEGAWGIAGMAMWRRRATADVRVTVDEPATP